MERFDFDRLVERDGAGSLKGRAMPEKLREAGLPSYWGAEFDFPTCPAFSAGVMDCARRGLYAFTLQTEDYNSRVRWWMANVRNWQIEADWIVPAHGTIFALATAIRTFVGEGQHLLMITPGYSRYKQAADRLGRETVFCPMAYDPAAKHYSLDFDLLESRMADPRCGLLVLCNPNNPTGLTLRGQELRRIDALSRKYRVPVFSDEIFAEITLDGTAVTPYCKAAAEDSLSLTCTSLGKCMSLTGVNHANVIIPNPEVRERYVHQKYADHYGSIDPMLYAGLMRAYTPEGKDWLEALLEVIRENFRNFTSGVEAALPGAKVIRADGTYVAWVDYTDTGLSRKALAERLDRGLFFGDPGSEYFADDMFYRYSIAVPPSMLRKSMDYLYQALH